MGADRSLGDSDHAFLRSPLLVCCCCCCCCCCSTKAPLLLALAAHNMDGHTGLRNFLANEEGLVETRLRCVTQMLEQEAGGLPSHILEALNHLRQNAEEDLS